MGRFVGISGLLDRGTVCPLGGQSAEESRSTSQSQADLLRQPTRFSAPMHPGDLLCPRHTMTIIMVMKDATLPLAEIKARLSEIVERVASRHERITLTRNGRPAAVLISPDDLEALEDTLEILSNPQALEEIEKARQEIARGEVVTGEELRAKYLTD